MDQPFAAPPGYVWTGTVFARLDPVPGDYQNVMTVTQAANVWGAANPGQYSSVADQPLPVNTPTPTYGMDENGNIGPVTDPAYLYSVNQAAAGAQMLQDQLMASGANPYNAPAGEIFSTTPAPIVNYAPGPTTAPVDPRATVSTSGSTSGLSFVNPDARSYFERYPDVAAQYRTNAYGLTPDQYAVRHYELHGAAEGRIWSVDPNTIPGDYLFPTGSANSGSTPAPAPAPAAAPTPAPRGNMATPYIFAANIQFADAAAYAYFVRYPDVAAAYRANSFGMTPDAYARAHYERFGVPERRVWSASLPVGGGAGSGSVPSGGTASDSAAAAGGSALPLILAAAAAYFLG